MFQYKPPNPQTSFNSPQTESFHIYKRILAHWGLPPIAEIINGELYLAPEKYSQPDEEIDNHLSSTTITSPNKDGEEAFLLEFRTACKLAGKLIKNPEKDVLSRAYQSKNKKLTKILNNLKIELSSYTPEEYAYISDIFQRQVDYSKELMGQPTMVNCLPKLIYNVDCLYDALLTGKGITKTYFDSFRGGYSKAKSTKAAMQAIAESYYECFGAMPTSTENSAFIGYGTALYRYLYFSDVDNKFEASLYKNAKEAIQKLKDKLGRYKNNGKNCPFYRFLLP